MRKYKFLALLFFLFIAIISKIDVNAEDLMAHNIYSYPNISNTSGVFDTYIIDFRITKDAKYTYWALLDFDLDLISLQADSKYKNVSGGHAYAGVQNNESGKQTIMSIWEIKYTLNSETTQRTINATNIYPGGAETFDGEGSGVKKLINYNYTVNNWYRMVIHTWQDTETGNTFIGQWIKDLNSNKWTLQTYYDTHIKSTEITGQISLFQENYYSPTAKQEREINFKNMYVYDNSKRKYVSLNESTLSYSYYLEKIGKHEFGVIDNYFYGLTGGNVTNQSSYDSMHPQQSLTASISQPNQFYTEDVFIDKFLLNDKELSWVLPNSSAPQETAIITIKNLENNTVIHSKKITRPEIRNYVLPSNISLPRYGVIELSIKDIYGNLAQKQIQIDERSKINTLKSLSLSSGNIQFSPTINTYTVNVKNNVDHIAIQSQLTDDKSSYVQGYGNRVVPLNVGENEILIKVKSEYGTENVYTINVIREEAPFLNSIKINGQNLEGFSSDKFVYDIYLEATTVNIETTQDSKYTVSGVGEKTLELGLTSITLTVTNKLGDVQEYILNIITAEQEPYLNDIKIDNNSIEGFEKTKFSYELENSNERINISATPNNQRFNVSGDIGNKLLNYGNNIYKIRVSNHSGKNNEYALSVNRPDNRNKDNTIKTISLSVGQIAFNPSINTYEIQVSNDVTKIAINAVLNADNSTFVEGYGNREVILETGINVILLKVKAENETINTYTFNIIRETAKIDSHEKSTPNLVVDVPNTSKAANIIAIIIAVILLASGSIITYKTVKKYDN